jgi:hypothetical protein
VTHIVLDVPFVTQLGFGDPANPRDDPTGCWYASACMVGYFFEAGPRLGAPQFFKRGLGRTADGRRTGGHKALQLGEYPILMANEELVTVPQPAGGAWTAAGIADLLRRYGPLMFIWTKRLNGQEYGHASVVVGVIDAGTAKVVVHDPENAPFSLIPVSDFNSAFWFGAPEAMLRRDGPEFQRTFNPGAVAAIPAPKPKLPMGVHTPPAKSGAISGRLASLFGR